MCYQRAARWLAAGGLLAHQTATLPGVAACPDSEAARVRLRCFKQRQGPFLLLCSSRLRTRVRVRRWLRWRSRMVRDWLRKPSGDTTYLLPASARAPHVAVRRGTVALRWVQDAHTLALLERAGGVLCSSSLNRKGAAVAPLSRRRCRRWSRFRVRLLPGGEGSGRPSALLDLRGRRPVRVR